MNGEHLLSCSEKNSLKFAARANSCPNLSEFTFQLNSDKIMKFFKQNFRRITEEVVIKSDLKMIRIFQNRRDCGGLINEV